MISGFDKVPGYMEEIASTSPCHFYHFSSSGMKRNCILLKESLIKNEPAFVTSEDCAGLKF